MAVFIRYTDETSLRRRPGDVPRAPAEGRKGWLCGIPAALGAGVAALLRRPAAGDRREVDPIARVAAAGVQVQVQVAVHLREEEDVVPILKVGG